MRNGVVQQMICTPLSRCYFFYFTYLLLTHLLILFTLLALLTYFTQLLHL